MSAPPCVAEVKVESYVFPATAKPPGTAKTLILGGAGARGLNIDGKFVKFTAIGVYLEADAVPSLAVKWNGKSAEELTDSVQFFRDVVTGPFEKLTRITMILPLSGKQYSEKVSENCVAFWKAAGIYGDAESKAIEKFNDVFSDQMFPPGASIFFTQSPLGSLTLYFGDWFAARSPRFSSEHIFKSGRTNFSWLVLVGFCPRFSCGLLSADLIYAPQLMFGCFLWADFFRRAMHWSNNLTQCPPIHYELQISFSKEGSMPEIASAVIENKPLSEAVLESIIGSKGVSPEAKQSLAVRLSELFKNGVNGGDAITGKVGCENDVIPQTVVSK
nr:chalcone isomerase [Ipomoea batatas]